MPDERENMVSLYQRFLSNQCTEAEVASLLEYFDIADEGQLAALVEAELNREEMPVLATPEEQARLDELQEKIKATIHGQSARVAPMDKARRFRRWAAAAAVLVLLGGGTLYYLQHSPRPAPVHPVASRQDVPPGGNKAVLTLSNGQQVILDSAHNGQLASQGNSKIIKVNNGLLAYNSKPITHNSKLITSYNTLTTPRGGQYRLILPDGSKVWLDAASSIRYPVAFTGSERLVEITGEAYFEIAKDPAMPFAVKKGNTEIQVLGTHFNINAYDDEPNLKVTLLEGTVRVALLTTHHSLLTT